MVAEAEALVQRAAIQIHHQEELVPEDQDYQILLKERHTFMLAEAGPVRTRILLELRRLTAELEAVVEENLGLLVKIKEIYTELIDREQGRAPVAVAEAVAEEALAKV
jgi:hypothetical protein